MDVLLHTNSWSYFHAENKFGYIQFSVEKMFGLVWFLVIILLRQRVVFLQLWPGVR